MSGVRYTLVESNTTDSFSQAGGVVNNGFNIPGGSVDEIIIRLQGTLAAAADLVADTGSLIQNLQIVLNGETITQFRSNFSNDATVGESAVSYFFNSMGQGRAVDVNTSVLVKDFYLRIPVGRNIPSGISRLEYSIQYAGTGAAVTTPIFQCWMRYNPQFQQTTTIGAATSYLTAGAAGGVQEEVVVRIPQNVPGFLAGVLVQGGSAADSMTSARIVNQSDYSIDLDMWRALNGDLSNGLMYQTNAAAVAGQGLLTFAQASLGLVFLPLYNLSLKDDLRMQITTTAAETFTFTPVIVSPVVGKPQAGAVQTQPVVTSTSGSILTTSAAQV